MAVYKEVAGDNELYIWMNGKLIYKKWLDRGNYRLFDLMETYTCITLDENGKVRFEYKYKNMQYQPEFQP